MPKEQTDNPAVQHEESDVNIRAILSFAGGLIVVALVIHVAVWGLFRYFDARERQQPAAEYPLVDTTKERQPPEPRLQRYPREDMLEMRAEEDRILTTYAIDRNTGVVRIPIDQAMKITVQRGLTARPEAAR
jgi:hypothetical protein